MASPAVPVGSDVHRSSRRSQRRTGPTRAPPPPHRTTSGRGAVTRRRRCALDRGRRGDPRRDRVGARLRRGRLRRLHIAPPRHRHRSDQPRGDRGAPRRGAPPTGATSAPDRAWSPPGPALHDLQRGARRAPRVGAQPLVLRRRSHDLSVARAPDDRHPAPMGGDGRDLRGHGRLQLVRPPRQPPRPRTLALPRAPPLPGGHERADRLSNPSADPRLVPDRAPAGHRAVGQRHDADDGPRRLRRDGRVRPLEHQPRVRAPGTHLRQPELPSPPPSPGGRPGHQPRVRAHDLGPAVPSCGVPDGRDDQDRHRTPRSPADRRADGAAPRHFAVFASQLVAPFRPSTDDRDSRGTS